MRTYTRIPPEIAERLTRSLQRDGLITGQQSITAVRKTYFYTEHFNLLEFLGPDGELTGYYSDIGLPLAKTEEGYAMTDLFLDIWLSPEGRLIELDWDEFEAAISSQLIDESQAQAARITLARLVQETQSGIYPSRYLAANPKEIPPCATP